MCVYIWQQGQHWHCAGHTAWQSVQCVQYSTHCTLGHGQPDLDLLHPDQMLPGISLLGL